MQQVDMSDLVAERGFDAGSITELDLAHCRRCVDSLEGVRSAAGRVTGAPGREKLIKAPSGSFYALSGEAWVMVTIAHAEPRVEFGTDCTFTVPLERERHNDQSLEDFLDGVVEASKAKIDEIGARAILLCQVAEMVSRWWDARRSLKILARQS